LIQEKEERELIRLPMKGAVRQLSLDSKGTHVVQKAIAKLVTNNHGLCMAKKLLAQTKRPEKKARFMALISAQALEIMQN
jgi:hypothetical protein